MDLAHSVQCMRLSFFLSLLSALYSGAYDRLLSTCNTQEHCSAITNPRALCFSLSLFHRTSLVVDQLAVSGVVGKTRGFGVSLSHLAACQACKHSLQYGCLSTTPATPGNAYIWPLWKLHPNFCSAYCPTSLLVDHSNPPSTHCQLLVPCHRNYNLGNVATYNQHQLEISNMATGCVSAKTLRSLCHYNEIHHGEYSCHL